MNKQTNKLNSIEQPETFTPGVTREMVREHALKLYRDKIAHHPLAIEDWVLAEKDLVENIQTENLLSR